MKFFAILSFLGICGSIVLSSPIVVQAEGIIPSYAHTILKPGEELITGKIESIINPYHLSIVDERGFIDSVALHHGTVIKPTGIVLRESMKVTIIGKNDGNEFSAREIDTPYEYNGSHPTSIYYGPGWWYPGYNYGFGPSFLLVFDSYSGNLIPSPFYDYGTSIYYPNYPVYQNTSIPTPIPSHRRVLLSEPNSIPRSSASSPPSSSGTKQVVPIQRSVMVPSLPKESTKPLSRNPL